MGKLADNWEADSTHAAEYRAILRSYRSGETVVRGFTQTAKAPWDIYIQQLYLLDETYGNGRVSIRVLGIEHSYDFISGAGGQNAKVILSAIDEGTYFAKEDNILPLLRLEQRAESVGSVVFHLSESRTRDPNPSNRALFAGLILMNIASLVSVVACIIIVRRPPLVGITLGRWLCIIFRDSWTFPLFSLVLFVSSLVLLALPGAAFWRDLVATVDLTASQMPSPHGAVRGYTMISDFAESRTFNWRSRCVFDSETMFFHLLEFADHVPQGEKLVVLCGAQHARDFQRWMA